MKKEVKVILIIFLVLLIDQSLKIWVKTNMHYGDEIKMLGLNWALIHFVENNGMAFGISLGGDYGKLALSIFRIIAVGFLIYYLRMLIRAKASFGLLASFALILAGAIGNILDSAFYGLIFSESPYHGGLATLFPSDGGYAGLLHGKVVDMLYFPVFKGHFPSWFPIWSEEPFLFFKPVFNIADLSITLGVLNILLFQRNFFKHSSETHSESDPNLSEHEGEGEVSSSEIEDMPENNNNVSDGDEPGIEDNAVPPEASSDPNPNRSSL